MKVIGLTFAIAAAIGTHAAADQPMQRGALMKTCVAEWQARSKAPAAEKIKYTQFLSECLKRHNAGAKAKR